MEIGFVLWATEYVRLYGPPLLKGPNVGQWVCLWGSRSQLLVYMIIEPYDNKTNKHLIY
jgi:hypothetical protein